MIKQIGTLNIEIERRKIKNINIYVKPPNGDVLVTVPMRVSNEEVFRFLKKKEDWILKNHKKVKNRQNSSQQEIKSGTKKMAGRQDHRICNEMGTAHESSCEWFYDSRYENKMGKL